jgi:DNA-binding GntR family transcriptional regulator
MPERFPTLEPLDRRSTPTIVAEAIRSQILEGRFEPGMQLTESQLATQLDVSRGPVREAFQRLVQEGLLVAEPHRGVFVPRLEADDVADVYVARAAIERSAARLLVRRGDPAVLDELGALVTEMSRSAEGGSWSDIADADLRFHETLVAGARSPRLARMYDTLLVETRLCFRNLGDITADPDEVVAEHRALLDALRAGDEDGAAACVEDHLIRASNDSVGLPG